MAKFTVDNGSPEQIVKDIKKLAHEKGFPCTFTADTAEFIIKRIRDNSMMLFGRYSDGILVSIGTLSIFSVFPCPDSPNGLVGHISGVYTHPQYRRRGHSTKLLDEMTEAGRLYGCDYLCLDSTADELYCKAGFVRAPEGETRMWKRI